MQFDPDNLVVKLCGEGMNLEGAGKIVEAHQFFIRAWNESITDFEKCTAAHYVARIQGSPTEKLQWDWVALEFALKADLKACYPSLYLNIGKCYEDLNKPENAMQNYQLGLTFTDSLDEGGYGKMIRSGIMAGIERVTPRADRRR